MIKTFLEQHKIEMIEAYVVGMVCFICMSGLGMTWISMAIMIGLANTYLVSPVVKALKFGNESTHDIMKVNHKLFFKNECKAVFICSLLVCVYFVIDRYIFGIGVEPISFGILYKVVDKGIQKIGLSLMTIIAGFK